MASRSATAALTAAAAWSLVITGTLIGTPPAARSSDPPCRSRHRNRRTMTFTILPALRGSFGLTHTDEMGFTGRPPSGPVTTRSSAGPRWPCRPARSGGCGPTSAGPAPGNRVPGRSAASASFGSQPRMRPSPDGAGRRLRPESPAQPRAARRISTVSCWRRASSRASDPGGRWPAAGHRRSSRMTPGSGPRRSAPPRGSWTSPVPPRARAIAPGRSPVARQARARPNAALMHDRSTVQTSLK